MPEGEEKQRFSARVTVQTLDDIESYQHSQGLETRSAAIEHLVEHYEERQRTASRWDRVAEQALYAVTFSLVVAVISTVALVAMVIQAGYPSPWTAVALSLVVGSVLTATGSTFGYRYASEQADDAVVGVAA
jgi:hypothetical protein